MNDTRADERKTAVAWAAPIVKNKSGKRLAFPAPTKATPEMDDF